MVDCTTANAVIIHVNLCNNIQKNITRLWLVDFSAVNPKQQCNFL
jgi:hypothetical protein